MFIAFSCSKETDEQPPIILVASPVDMQQVQVGDTVHVTGKIIDNRIVESVSVSLLDGNNIPVLSTISVQPNSPEFNLDILVKF